MQTSTPPLMYWQPETIKLMKLVKDKFVNQNVDMGYVSKFAKDVITVKPL